MATESPYWNPKTETLDRKRIEALQLAKLRLQVEWAAARSPWYQRSLAAEGFDPAQLRTLDDLRRIPFLTRDDWMASQEEKPPYGELPTIGGSGAIRIHTTSGTTGRGPLRALDSRKDWAWIAEMWCYGIWGCGIRPSDTAYVAFGYGSFIGFWGLHYAMEKIGVLNVPGGAQTTEARRLAREDQAADVRAAQIDAELFRLLREPDRVCRRGGYHGRAEVDDLEHAGGEPSRCCATGPAISSVGCRRPRARAAAASTSTRAGSSAGSTT